MPDSFAANAASSTNLNQDLPRNLFIGDNQKKFVNSNLAEFYENSFSAEMIILCNFD